MCVNKIGAARTGSERVNKIVPGEQNRSKYEQNRGKYEQNRALNKIGAVQLGQFISATPSPIDLRKILHENSVLQLILQKRVPALHDRFSERDTQAATNNLICMPMGRTGYSATSSVCVRVCGARAHVVCVCVCVVLITKIIDHKNWEMIACDRSMWKKNIILGLDR